MCLGQLECVCADAAAEMALAPCTCDERNEVSCCHGICSEEEPCVVCDGAAAWLGMPAQPAPGPVGEEG